MKRSATPFDMIRFRLRNQLLSRSGFSRPEDVVAWLGAVQSQDYAGAKWALSQRLKEAMTDAELDSAFNAGAILRTHVMRPTWHFVSPTDIRWMRELTAPRVRAALAPMDRQLGMDKSIFRQAKSVLSKALQGNRQLTRAELAPILNEAGVPVDGLRLGHLLMHAELDGIICSGARKGKQFTYALLEDRAPQAKTLDRDQALVELTRRYFRSHGPATARDFVWWSGLTMTDVRRGIEAIGSEFKHETVGDRTYWLPKSRPVSQPSSRAYLLPSYDEYTVGYTDRSAIYDGANTDKLGSRESILTQTILIDGRIAGTWKRTLKKSEVVIDLAPFTMLDQAQSRAVVAAARKYGRFIGLPAVLSQEFL
jgi:hypothetical protein